MERGNGVECTYMYSKFQFDTMADWWRMVKLDKKPFKNSSIFYNIFQRGITFRTSSQLLLNGFGQMMTDSIPNELYEISNCGGGGCEAYE